MHSAACSFYFRLLTNSFDEIGAFQRALKSYISSIDTVYAKQYEEFHVGFEGRQVIFV